MQLKISDSPPVTDVVTSINQYSSTTSIGFERLLPKAVGLKVLSGLLKTLTSVDSKPMTEFKSAGLLDY